MKNTTKSSDECEYLSRNRIDCIVDVGEFGKVKALGTLGIESFGRGRFVFTCCGMPIVRGTAKIETEES